jgi:hypothetical protein
MMTENKNKIEKPIEQPINVFGSGFEIAQRMANALAASGIVPDMYRGNIPNCLIALDVANRIGIGVLAVMQKMYIVHGKPAFETTFVAAAVNACGRYTPIRCRCNGKDGDEYGYYAVATEKATGEELIGTTVNWKMVKAEEWHTKNGSKWKTLPEQMFKYRAMSFWQREFEPGITMGIMTTDEVEDITIDIEKVESAPKTLDDVIEANKQRAAKTEKPTESEKPQNKAAEDIQEATRQQAMETEALRVSVIDKAREKWGDDGMIKLGQLLRSNGTTISDAGMDALNWALEEMR